MLQFARRVAGCAGVWLAAALLSVAVEAQTQTDLVARVERQLAQARARFQTETNDDAALWEYGRACYDFAQLASNRTERAEIAEQGIAVCRQLIARRPDSVAGHYYLGMNLGQLADTKRNLAALKMVKEMEQEFQKAADLEAGFDHAGPDRNLGLLYLQAPAIISVGSRSKAHQHLQRAVELAPDYPENRLNLCEAYLKWGEYNGALRQIKALKELWPAARRQLDGTSWAPAWQDWEQRLEQAKKKVDASSRVTRSPRVSV
jgi:tetratricopeptide (TPR) repeat protein